MCDFLKAQMSTKGCFYQNNHLSKITIVLVGLPARSKTFIGKSLSRYLGWIGIHTKTFSVAEYRRNVFGEKLDPSYYDPSRILTNASSIKSSLDNVELYNLRFSLAQMALNDLMNWLKEENSQVAIFDAANITFERRKWVNEQLVQNNFKVIFLEVICNDPKMIEENFKNGAQYSPEYIGVDLQTALLDMKARLAFYEPYYSTISEELEMDLDYIKIANVREDIVTNNIKGYLPARMAFYLMNMTYVSRNILFLKESNNAKDNPKLEKLLTVFKLRKNIHKITVWSSTCPTSIELSKVLCNDPLIKSQLSRIETSAFEKKTIEQIKFEFPSEYEKYIQDPYYHRFPGGESYHDLTIRLENILFELEGSPDSILILADASVLRCLYAYYTNIPAKKIPLIEIPDSCLIQLIPSAYGTIESRYILYESEEALRPIIQDEFKYIAC